MFFLGMSRGELVDTLARLTVHNDEELRGLACQGLQNLVIDFPDWREDVLYGFMQFVVKVSVLFGCQCCYFISNIFIINFLF